MQRKRRFSVRADRLSTSFRRFCMHARSSARSLSGRAAEKKIRDLSRVISRRPKRSLRQRKRWTWRPKEQILSSRRPPRPEPYLEPQHLEAASVYCHIGFHEITHAAIERFSDIVVDTWQEAKDVSGQSLFRYYREGLVGLERISSTLGAAVARNQTIPRCKPRP